MTRYLPLLFVVFGGLAMAQPVGSTPCVPARDRPSAPPRPNEVVFHEEQFDVVGDRDAFVRAFLAAPLERFIKGTARLPGVDHTEPETAARYPAVGSIRRVHLKDGQSACEEVLTQNDHQLRYQVTSYTSSVAAPVAWGLGEFTFTPSASGTHVTWRYSFLLRGDRFPGSLGCLGRWLFRSSFVEADYAPFMLAQVREIQAFAKEATR